MPHKNQFLKTSQSPRQKILRFQKGGGTHNGVTITAIGLAKRPMRSLLSAKPPPESILPGSSIAATASIPSWKWTDSPGGKVSFFFKGAKKNYHKMPQVSTWCKVKIFCLTGINSEVISLVCSLHPEKGKTSPIKRCQTSRNIQNWRGKNENHSSCKADIRLRPTSGSS